MKFREIIVKSINIAEGNYTNNQDEIKSFEPLEIYLVPRKEGSHERFVTDNNGIISKQSADSNDTFDNITNRGNSTTKNEIVLASAKGRSAALGFNEKTSGYYFGDMNPEHTGSNNLGFGINTLKKLSSGSYNTSVGCYSLSEVSEGSNNTTLGYATAYQLNRSSTNVFIGHYTGFNLRSEILESDLANISPAAAAYMKEQVALSGYNGTSFNSSLNTYVGGVINSNGSTPVRAAMSTIIGASTLNNTLYRNFNNIVIGAGNYMRTANSAMNNSIIIGNCINLPNQVDALVIGSNKSRRINSSEAIIYGELPNNRLSINAPLTIPSQYMPNAQGSSEFSKNIVAKPDGTFGWENKTSDDLRSLSYMSELTYTHDNENYYIKGTAYLCMKDGAGGNAGIGNYLKVFVDNAEIEGTSADRDNWYLNNFSYTTGEGTFKVSQLILPFTITIPKSTHPEPFWTSGYFYATVVSTHNPFDYDKPTILQKSVKLTLK
ncbi:hypothetical protein [Chryseobacterium mucoviscidosis]|uniref:hypothetical protein n=1 Tax=Chryseobacterium mucoviscidosis TaxID=1945581 RepID=UPI0031DAA019